MSEWLFIWSSMEFVLDNVSMGVHVREGAWGKSESVVGSKKSSHECLSFWFVDFSSSVIVIFGPEIIEVSGNVSINFIFLNNMESSNDICRPLWSWGLWKFPDTSSGSYWVSFFNSVSLENIVDDIILISSIAFIRKMISITGVRSLGRWGPWGFWLDCNSLGDW